MIQIMTFRNFEAKNQLAEWLPFSCQIYIYIYNIDVEQMLSCLAFLTCIFSETAICLIFASYNISLSLVK